MKGRTEHLMVATFSTVLASAFFTVPFLLHYMKVKIEVLMYQLTEF
jgi:hypothetical protein